MSRATHATGRFLGREAAARVDAGRLVDFIVAPPASAGPAPGSVWVVRPGRPAKGMGGGFAEAGGMNVFVRGIGPLREGKPALVQVTAFGDATKAAVATTRIALRGQHAVLTPGAPGVNLSRSLRDDAAAERLLDLGTRLMASGPPDAGLILRTGAADAPEADVAAEIAELIDRLTGALAACAADRIGEAIEAPSPFDRLRTDWGQAQADAETDAFDRLGVFDGLRHLSSNPGNSAAMSVEPTRAFVAVDVNTGDDRSPAAGLKANLKMADDLPRALRVLGLGGQVVIDAAPMPKADRRRVEQALARSLRHDPVETSVAGWTPLGHLELNRQRSRYAWITEYPDGLPDL